MYSLLKYLSNRKKLEIFGEERKLNKNNIKKINKKKKASFLKTMKLLVQAQE